MDDLHFFSEVVINNVLNGQRATEARKTQVADKTMPNSQQPNLQVTVSQEPKEVVGQQPKGRKTVQALPDDALW